MHLRQKLPLSAVLGTALLVLAVSLGGCASTTALPTNEAEPVPAPGSPAAAPLEEQAPLANTLRWRTASEVDNFGFDVFRGLAEEGPFEKLNDETIPGAGTTDEPQQYAYVDETIEPGTEYWYYVESISIAGVREQFTPIFKAKAKFLAEQ